MIFGDGDLIISSDSVIVQTFASYHDNGYTTLISNEECSSKEF